MSAVKLTDRFISSLRPPSRTVYFDAKTKGLALRVSPRGSRTWACVYRSDGRPPPWVTLGTYPALGLADARARALDRRHAIDVEKRDPAAEERAARAAAPAPEGAGATFTFADLVRLYEAFAKGRKKTWRDDMAMARRHLLPAWGSMPLRVITRAHVHELLDTLAAKGLTTGVNGVQAVISRLFTVALDRSLVDAHPAARMIERFKERPSDRVLTDDELRALWLALDARPGAPADAIRLRLRAAWPSARRTWSITSRRTCPYATGCSAYRTACVICWPGITISAAPSPVSWRGRSSACSASGPGTRA